MANAYPYNTNNGERWKLYDGQWILHYSTSACSALTPWNLLIAQMTTNPIVALSEAQTWKYRQTGRPANHHFTLVLGPVSRKCSCALVSKKF
jgi:hypothetical protein